MGPRILAFGGVKEMNEIPYSSGSFMTEIIHSDGGPIWDNERISNMLWLGRSRYIWCLT
jgi:hypothetical protein